MVENMIDCVRKLSYGCVEKDYGFILEVVMANIIELRGGNNRKRVRIVRPYPLNVLKEARELVKAMYEANSGLPVNRIMLAEALGIAPSSSAYTTLLNSCSKYGLTKGNYRSSKIELTEFGNEFVQNIVNKESSNSRLLLKQAASEPEIFKQFYAYYENKKIPPDNIAEEYIQSDLKVNSQLSAECLNLIKKNGVYAGFIKEIKGSLYIEPEESEFEIPFDPPPEIDSVGAPGSSAPNVTVISEFPNKTIGKLLFGHFGAENVADYLKEMFDELDIEYEDKELVYPDPATNPSGIFSNELGDEFDLFIMLVGESSYTRVAGGKETSIYEMTTINHALANGLFNERIISVLDSQIEFPNSSGRVINYEESNLESIILPLLSELKDVGFLEINTNKLN